MNATQLNKLTAPLFARHQSAKPDLMRGNLIPDDDAPKEYVSAAALIIQGHIIEWLAEKGEAPECMKWDDGTWVVYVNVESHTGATLLEALVAACMEVPQ